MTAISLFSLIISAGNALIAAYIIITRRQRSTWVMEAVLLLACALLTLAHSLLVLSPAPRLKLFWYELIYASFAVITSAFFQLSLDYAGYKSKIAFWWRLLLVILPVVSIIILFTSQWHGLFWKPALQDRIGYSADLLKLPEIGPWYWVFLAHCYIPTIAGFVLVVRSLRRFKAVCNWPTAIFVIFGLVAAVCTTVDSLHISPWPPFAVTAFGFSLSTIASSLVFGKAHRQSVASVSRSAIIDHIDDAILVLDIDNRIVDLNPAAKGLLGQPAAQLYGKDIGDFLPELTATRQRSVSDGEISIIVEGLRRDFDFHISVIKDSSDKLISEVVVLRDISDTKRTQEDIRRATEGVKSIFWRSLVSEIQNADTGVIDFVWDTRYLNLDVVNRFISLQPYHTDKLSDRFFYSQPEDDRIAMHERSREALLRGAESYSQEFRIIDSEGHTHWLLENARIQKLGDKRFEVRGIMVEITELKAAERALAESETRLSVLFESDPIGKLIIRQRDKTVQDANPAALALIGLDRSEVIGQHCQYFLCSGEKDHCPICDHGQLIDNAERNLINSQGQSIPVLQTVVPITIQGEAYFLESFADIRDRKQVEKRLIAAVKEKESLLKELHHRVKNNMQIISSLLGLQIAQINDQATIALIRDSQKRIHSMSLIHEKLYSSKNLSSVRFDEYLNDLTNSLTTIYSFPSHDIKFKIDAEALYFDIDTAIICGLIVNELASNSLKHGFPHAGSAGNKPKTNGVISIKLHKTDDGNINLKISDNGIGFPVDSDFQNRGSLGLLLVASLVDQLKGSINYKTNNGAQIEINFPKPTSNTQNPD